MTDHSYETALRDALIDCKAMIAHKLSGRTPTYELDGQWRALLRDITNLLNREDNAYWRKGNAARDAEINKVLAATKKTPRFAGHVITADDKDVFVDSFYDLTVCKRALAEQFLAEHAAVCKEVVTDHFLNGGTEPWFKSATFDGEAGTYSDAKCSVCSPVHVAFPDDRWSRV